MNRQQLIDNGKIWVVYESNPDEVLFEGCKTKCLSFIKDKFGLRQYKLGNVRLGKVIYEPSEN